MQKWEYTAIIQMWDNQEKEWYWVDAEEIETRGVLERLNTLGSEGWELVNILYGPGVPIQYFLKRPL